MNQKKYLNEEDVARIKGISRADARRLISSINEEIEEHTILRLNGVIRRPVFEAYEYPDLVA